MSYRPTPAGLARDIRDLLDLLRVAVANMNRLHMPTNTEETTAGHCYEPTKVA